MSKKQTHVVPNSNKGGWDIKHEHSQRSSGHFDNKREAENRARQISQNQQTELFIHNRDGKISRRDSHGNDPFPPRDEK
jgi:hypothetical protein